MTIPDKARHNGSDPTAPQQPPPAKQDESTPKRALRPDPTAPPQSPPVRSSWRGPWPWLLAMLLAMLIFAAGVMLAPVFLVNKTVDVAVTGLQQMVHDITSGKLAMEFNHSGAKLNRHSHLDVCSFETLEIFTASDQRKYWPDIKVEGRVPVTYTYYIDLKKKIDIRINNGPFREGDLRTPELTITVPPIEWNPPALHTHKMVMRDLETSMLRSEDKLRQRLARSMYPACRDRRAGKYLSLIEQSAKESIREFMYTWFVQSKYANAPIKPIITEIIFAKPHAPILKPDPER